MGKLLILSVTDHEEHILNKIMELIADEPEFIHLAHLARHPGWVFSAHQIYEAIWRKDSEHCGTAVASVIGQIRRKLTPDTPKGGYIRTVLGSGYKFNSSPF